LKIVSQKAPETLRTQLTVAVLHSLFASSLTKIVHGRLISPQPVAMGVLRNHAVAAAVCVAAALPAVPNVTLYNAAVPGLQMPAVGLGTGAYSDNNAVG
jgi:hypothetical protein